jgi:GTP-binding protein
MSPPYRPNTKTTPSGNKPAAAPRYMNTEDVKLSPLLQSARFFITAAELSGLPKSTLPEVAFVGRSNAGKSTCINTLAQQKRLAFSSKTPGRTQHINYFAVGLKEATQGYMVDLPGYGYAAVPEAAKLRWQQFLAGYLRVREPLKALVLIADSRLGLTTLDLALLSYMQANPRPVHVLLAKSDKLSTNEKRAIMTKTEGQLGDALVEFGLENLPTSLQLFSATSKEGLSDLSSLVQTWLTP